MKLSLNNAGAEALRDFSSSMETATNNITEATSKLFNVYSTEIDQLGEHSYDFEEMLRIVTKAQRTAAEAISELPPMMRKVADKIDVYVKTHQ